MTTMLESIEKNLVPLYEKMDKQVEEMVVSAAQDGNPVSCKRGCMDCCYLMTTVVLAEGLWMAKELLKESNWVWMGVARKCKEMSKLYDDPTFSRMEYLKEKHPCPLLDTEKKECSFYRLRPAACRYYFSASPAEHCSPDAGVMDIMSLNTTKPEATIWELAEKITGVSLAAPLPLMLLHCMQSVATKKNKLYMTKMTQGVTNPAAWTKMSAANKRMMRESSPDVRNEVNKSVRDVKGMFSVE